MTHSITSFYNWPNRVQQTAQFDVNRRMTNLGALGPSGVASPLNSAYYYAYNAATWTTAYTTKVNGTETAAQLGHFPAGRLTQWTGQPHGPESWAYDPNGNLISDTGFISDAIRTTVFTYSGTIPNEVL